MEEAHAGIKIAGRNINNLKYADDPSLTPGSERSAGEGIDRLLTPVFLGFPWGSDGKESACNAGDARDTSQIIKIINHFFS